MMMRVLLQGASRRVSCSATPNQTRTLSTSHNNFHACRSSVTQNKGHILCGQVNSSFRNNSFSSLSSSRSYLQSASQYPSSSFPKILSSQFVSKLHTSQSIAGQPEVSNSSTSPSSSSALQIGDKIGGFVLRDKQHIPSRNLTLLQFSHSATGAKHVHVDCEDKNNVFSVTFRTPPSSSNGVCHILEHTTLCGSKKYPVRDPFFHMLKRSLNTYMNAWTAADFTMYPFSTMNEKDYSNLMSVYLDATFFPKLDRYDFLQVSSISIDPSL